MAWRPCPALCRVPDTLYRDSTYLRVINEGSTRLNCYLSYPQGGWRVESTYGNNSSELARLARFIRTSLSRQSDLCA